MPGSKGEIVGGKSTLFVFCRLKMTVSGHGLHETRLLGWANKFKKMENWVVTFWCSMVRHEIPLYFFEKVLLGVVHVAFPQCVSPT